MHAMSKQRPTTALYVRLPHPESEKLERAASALATNKKTLVTNLVHHYVDPDSAEGLETLRHLTATATATATHRKVTVMLPDESLAVGHHHFTPTPAPEVLTTAQAAELLQVTEDEIDALAESGELPGRRIGDQWRFARSALLAWLAKA